MGSLVKGVDFVSIPTQDLERAVAFYRDVLALELSVHKPDFNFAEFENGTVTFNVLDPVRMGIGDFAPNPAAIALHVEDVAAAKAQLEEHGVTFPIGIVDTGVCHMAPFNDLDGNALLLHHRYAPRD